MHQPQRHTLIDGMPFFRIPEMLCDLSTTAQYHALFQLETQTDGIASMIFSARVVRLTSPTLRHERERESIVYTHLWQDENHQNESPYRSNMKVLAGLLARAQVHMLRIDAICPGHSMRITTSSQSTNACLTPITMAVQIEANRNSPFK